MKQYHFLACKIDSGPSWLAPALTVMQCVVVFCFSYKALGRVPFQKEIVVSFV